MDTALLLETPAGFGRRLAAFLIDTVILYVAGTLLQAVWMGAREVVVSILIQVAYFWALTGWFGRTPGKMALNIELRHPRGRIDFQTAALREILGKLISFLAVFLGVLWIAIDPQKRGWHDMIAGTRVVHVHRVPWQEWEPMIRGLLATHPGVTPAMLTGVKESWRPELLREFARRHPEMAVLEDGSLSKTESVELF